VTRVNSTANYYKSGEDSLGWELTVSNALYPADSPCRKLLKRVASYGDLLYDHLSLFVPMQKVRSLLEIGGGYGYVMKDFLIRNPSMAVTMVDISPRFSGIQSQTLKNYPVDYVVADSWNSIHRTLPGRTLPFSMKTSATFRPCWMSQERSFRSLLLNV